MDDGAPTLEVGFAIDGGGSFEQLAQLQAIMNTTEARVVAEAAKIEKATSGMVNIGGANIALKAFGSAATRELQSAAREAAQVEKSGERMVVQLERQNAAFGKTREELRAMRAEEAALAAERVGNNDLAQRLRAEEQALWGQEYAAARKARMEVEAAAEEKAIAAQKAAKAAEVEAQAVREAAQAYQVFEAHAKQAMQVYRDQQATQAIVQKEREAQALRDAAYAYQMFEVAARKGMAAMRDQQTAEASAAAEAERLAAAAERLKMSVDPAYAAQQRFDGEMARAKQLIGAGAVTLDDYCAKLRVEQGLLDQSTKAHGNLGRAQRFTAAETLNLSRQFQDIGVTAAMGMNPLMILVQQGPQVYDVLEQVKTRGGNAAAAIKQMGLDVVNYGVAGLGKLATFITPTNLLLAGTAVTMIAVVRSLGTYDVAMQRFEATAVGLGRVSGQTAQQLEAISEAAASSGQRSISATRDSVNAFASAGIQGTQTLTLLAANVERYAKLTGQDVPAAQTALAEAMKDPAQAADTFTQQLGLLTGAQYEHIKQLAAQGDQEQATAELTRILTRDLAANSNQTTGLAHYMDLLGSAVSGVATVFGRLDQRIKSAGASYDAWLKQHVGNFAVDLLGTGNKPDRAADPNAGRNQDQIAALNASQSLNTGGMKQFNDLLAQQRILQKGLADTTGMTSAQVQALRHDYSAITDTINANRTASGAWITTQERAHMVAQAQAKLAAAHTQAEKAAAQQQITRLQLGTQVLTQQERQTQALDAYNKVADKYVKPKTDRHAQTLADEAKAVEAQTGNLYKLADAYQVSGADALIAEARVKAESQAIKQRADVEAAVARQVSLSIAQRVADAEKAVAATRDQARIQAEVNGEVAAGNVPAELAAELVQRRIAELPVLQAAEAAQQLGLKDAADKATKALTDQRDAQERAKAAAYGKQANDDAARTDKALATLREEAGLIGASAEARVHALATLKATQEAQVAYGSTTNAFAQAYIAGQVAIADAAEQNRLAQQAYNDSLTLTADKWDIIAGKVQSAASGMADAFGPAGKAIGDLASIYASFNASRTRADVEHKKAITAAGKNETLVAQENARFALRSSGAQIEAYGDMVSAAKGFFKEGSTGYKALAAAEKVYRVAQLAMSLEAMVQNALETTTHVASAAVRATADGTAGIAKQSQLPFPANIAAMAATAAALVAAGVAVFGGGDGGGGSKNTLAKANDGTGTVLGDASAKSESLKRSIDTLKSVDDATLGVSRDMLTSLRAIETNIGNLSSLLVRTGNLNASAGVAEGFKTNAVGSILSKIPVIGGLLGSLFGTKTTVVGSGLYGGAQSIGDVLNSGFDAQTYSDIQKKKKFFGLTTSTKYSTAYAAAPDEIGQQFTLVLKSFYDAIDKAAGPLGLATGDVEARLQSFVVNIGKIDLQGLSGTEIQEKLEAVFGAAADGMAEAAIPGLDRFQKVGEGAFETLVRVASTVEQVDATFRKLGVTTTSLGIDVDMAVANMFDSVSDFTNLAATYFSTYYSKAEQAAAATAQIGSALNGLGLAMPDTLAGFRQLVEAQDLTTEAGRQTYVTLLQLAPAFADLKTSLEGTKSAADILAEQQDLQAKLLEVQGDTVAIRQAELAKLDPSNRALQEQIYAIQDAQDAAKAAADLKTAWQSVGDTIEAEIKRIRGLNDASGGGSFAALLGQFNAATASARGGDQDAAKLLPGLSQSLLTAAAAAATSRQELTRVQAQTAASLEETYSAIQAMTGITSATGVTDPAAVAASQAATTSTADSTAALVDEVRALREEVAQLRADNNSGHATTAGNTGAIKKTLQDVTADSGGNAISTMAAAA